ncbi:hypothetical protein PCANC_12356 [Puccinia coronata f. sp. avenae]|uniref:Uncharacterized protein n=1 Tax=Puccinia coronata f. sp. avenae TaxID=200324 RepID=A0A2N5V3Z8_9BASI|nr:hypothetical protein PCANC_23395 [Puccinia coronata f. sp. avenae]PLW44656.1 hypothetical protein PCANC_12356 [Puccinia coronata f. sp. avenae]
MPPPNSSWAQPHQHFSSFFWSAGGSSSTITSMSSKECLSLSIAAFHSNTSADQIASKYVGESLPQGSCAANAFTNASCASSSSPS